MTKARAIRQGGRPWVFGSRRIRSTREGAFPWLTPFFAAANMERQEWNGKGGSEHRRRRTPGRHDTATTKMHPCCLFQYLGAPRRDRVWLPGMPLAEVGTLGRRRRARGRIWAPGNGFLADTRGGAQAIINAGLRNSIRFVTCEADESKCLNEEWMKRDEKGGRKDQSDRFGWARCGFGGVTSSEPMEAPKTAAMPLPIPGLGQEVAWQPPRGWQNEGFKVPSITRRDSLYFVCTSELQLAPSPGRLVAGTCRNFFSFLRLPLWQCPSPIRLAELVLRTVPSRWADAACKNSWLPVNGQFHAHGTGGANAAFFSGRVSAWVATSDAN